MRQLLCLLIILLPVMAQAQVSISAYAAPLNDDGVGGSTFDVVVNLTNVGIGSNDSIIDMDDDGIIDPRRLVNSRDAGMDGWVVYYDWDDDSLYLGASGSSLTEEQVEDYVGTMVDGGTETRIAVTYTDGGDGAGLLNFVVDDMNDGNAAESEIHDSLNANWATFISDDDTQLSEEEVEDFVGGMLGGTETGISVTYQDGTNDIDFVVGVGWPLGVDADSVYLDSTEVVTWLYWTAAYDSVDNWNNLVNEAKDSLTSWANEVNATTDSLTSWANEVNAATDSLASWADEVNTNTDSVTAWANQVNDNSDDIDDLETEPRYLFTIYNPNSLWDADSLLIGIDPRTPVAITVTRIDVTCDADPGTELDFDLMWADARIGNANRIVIDEMNTTNGVTTITSGFDDATIAANKCIYIRFNAEPDADILDVNVRVTYTID